MSRKRADEKSRHSLGQQQTATVEVVMNWRLGIIYAIVLIVIYVLVQRGKSNSGGA
jgi:hypothetical protein